MSSLKSSGMIRCCLSLNNFLQGVKRIYMKKIRLLLEYKSYPMWIYDENDELIDNDIIEELKSEKEINEMLMEIQVIYDSLFIDSNTLSIRAL
jgi:hypothetical protein